MNNVSNIIGRTDLKVLIFQTIPTSLFTLIWKIKAIKYWNKAFNIFVSNSLLLSLQGAPVRFSFWL